MRPPVLPSGNETGARLSAYADPIASMRPPVLPSGNTSAAGGRLRAGSTLASMRPPVLPSGNTVAERGNPCRFTLLQ